MDVRDFNVQPQAGEHLRLVGVLSAEWEGGGSGSAGGGGEGKSALLMQDTGLLYRTVQIRGKEGVRKLYVGAQFDEVAPLWLTRKNIY